MRHHIGQPRRYEEGDSFSAKKLNRQLAATQMAGSFTPGGNLIVSTRFGRLLVSTRSTPQTTKEPGPWTARIMGFDTEIPIDQQQPADRVRFIGRRVDLKGTDIDQENIIIHVRTYPNKNGDLLWHDPFVSIPMIRAGSMNTIPIQISQRWDEEEDKIIEVFEALDRFQNSCEAAGEVGEDLPPPRIGGGGTRTGPGGGIGGHGEHDHLIGSGDIDVEQPGDTVGDLLRDIEVLGLL